MSPIRKMYWLPPPLGEGPDGKDCSTQGWGSCTFGWKGFFCSVSPGTSSIKASPLRWSITSLSDKEIITIRAAPLHITYSSHAVEVEEMNQWLSICSRSSVSTGFAAMGTDFLQAPDLSKSTPQTFWVLDFESQFSCMLGKCPTAEPCPHPWFPSPCLGNNCQCWEFLLACHLLPLPAPRSQHLLRL